MEDFKSILLGLVKYQNAQQEKWQKQLLSQQEKMENLFLQTKKENQERQLEFQKQVLELTRGSNPIENEFSFSKNYLERDIKFFIHSRGRHNPCVIL